MSISLSMTIDQHDQIIKSLMNSDNVEKVTWALCGKAKSLERNRYLVREIYPLPTDAYINNSINHVSWNTEHILDLLETAEKESYALLKIHNHPSGGCDFSEIDDISDKEISTAISDWTDSSVEFISSIITPDGSMIARTVDGEKNTSLSHIMIVGSNIKIFDQWESDLPNFCVRNLQAFGEQTFRTLRNLRIGIAGCSGTGSQIIEQIIRLGVGEVVLVDFDHVEDKNLNRITNTTKSDADNKRFKVQALKDSIERLGLGTKVIVVPNNINTKQAVRELSLCDVIFGCLDTKGGRHTLNRLSSFYSIPYFDVGVRLDADGNNGIDGIHASIHYLQPGKKSLIHRGVYDMEEIRAEDKLFEDPDGYAEEFKQGYVKGVNVDRPAVIPVNAMASSFAVLDFLGRLHNYRHADNDEIDKTLISVSGEILAYEQVVTLEKDIFSAFVGRGDISPLLNMPSIMGEYDND